MRVWQISSFGIDSLEFAERPTPEPGPGQVLVKIHAISLNFRDLMMVKGLYNPKLKLPRIPCSDGAGEVMALGPGVTQWKPGDRVAGIFMQNWLDGPPTPAKVRGALGGDIDGTLAEFVAFNENGLVPIPDHLSYQEAATLPCAAVTAWNALCAERSQARRHGAHSGHRRRGHLCPAICAVEGSARAGSFRQRPEAGARLRPGTRCGFELPRNSGVGSLGRGTERGGR